MQLKVQGYTQVTQFLNLAYKKVKTIQEPCENPILNRVAIIKFK
jgi:hypothetical protein